MNVRFTLLPPETRARQDTARVASAIHFYLGEIMKTLMMAISAFALSCSVASAASVPSSADVVFIVDESGSMSGEHTFLQNVIADLDVGLAAAGVSTVKYGVVGFGSGYYNPYYGDPRDLTGNGGSLGSLSQASTGLNNLEISGAYEDGYEAIAFALNTFASSLTGTAKNFILVTDEDRDITSYDTYASIKSALLAAGVILNVVVDNSLTSSLGDAIGVSDGGAAYVANGTGGFTEATDGVIGSGFGTTDTDYAKLALETGGAVWDLNKLRAGGLIADSFSAAFLDIKIQEVVDQIDDNTPVVPLPASLWLLLGGFGALVGARRGGRRMAV